MFRSKLDDASGYRRVRIERKTRTYVLITPRIVPGIKIKGSYSNRDLPLLNFVYTECFKNCRSAVQLSQTWRFQDVQTSLSLLDIPAP
jgi:hypothetical protein